MHGTKLKTTPTAFPVATARFFNSLQFTQHVTTAHSMLVFWPRLDFLQFPIPLPYHVHCCAGDCVILDTFIIHVIFLLTYLLTVANNLHFKLLHQFKHLGVKYSTDNNMSQSSEWIICSINVSNGLTMHLSLVILTSALEMFQLHLPAVMFMVGLGCAGFNVTPNTL